MKVKVAFASDKCLGFFGRRDESLASIARCGNPLHGGDGCYVSSSKR